MSGSAAPAIKAAIAAQLAALFPAPTLVSYGKPGINQPEEIVGVMNMRSTLEKATMGPSRPREETTELDVVFSVWQSGDEDRQPVVTERAYAMLADFETWLRTAPNEALAGVCREAWVSSYDLDEDTSIDPASGAVTGRIATLTATVTAKQRI